MAAVLQVCGNVMGLANNHSASRVIQWCLKEGAEADKAAMTAEVRANIVPLSKSKYGRHVVQKLISVAPKEQVPGGCLTPARSGNQCECDGTLKGRRRATLLQGCAPIVFCVSSSLRRCFVVQLPPRQLRGQRLQLAQPSLSLPPSKDRLERCRCAGM